MRSRYKIINFEIEAEPMTKWEYNKLSCKENIQHLENKRLNGFCCEWNGYRFWLPEDIFNQLHFEKL